MRLDWATRLTGRALAAENDAEAYPFCHEAACDAALGLFSLIQNESG